MENQFSPGPWFPQIENPLVVRDAHDLGIAVMLTDGISEQQAIANGRLVAAAPDLLAACERAMQVLDSIPAIADAHGFGETKKENCVICQLLDAIDKAKGGAR
jgi:hypothetical protein